MEKFKSFITEAKEESYKLIVFQNSNDVIRDVIEVNSRMPCFYSQIRIVYDII